MGKYIIWMIKYSEAMRACFKGRAGVDKMSFSELLELMKQPENDKKYHELTEFLTEVSRNYSSMEKQADSLEENFDKYFMAA